MLNKQPSSPFFSNGVEPKLLEIYNSLLNDGFLPLLALAFCRWGRDPKAADWMPGNTGSSLRCLPRESTRDDLEMRIDDPLPAFSFARRWRRKLQRRARTAG